MACISTVQYIWQACTTSTTLQQIFRIYRHDWITFNITLWVAMIQQVYL